MSQDGSNEEQPTAEVMELLRPFIAPLLARITVDEFTTVEFIEAMQLEEATSEAYQAALGHWPRNQRLAHMIIHGQVIPQLLRESRLVEWSGFAYEQEDPYAVPAWWRRIEAREDRSL